MEGSWSKERCCAVHGNECCNGQSGSPCYGNSGSCIDVTSSSDYLYRLSPSEPERYEPIPGGDAVYQKAGPTAWPTFGGGGYDLNIGHGDGPPGAHGYCYQGVTYRGSPNATCGGSYNWGHTDLEVWFI